MKIYYAGIGSRETPDSVLENMKILATYLAKKGLVLRSGAASGAGSAFEEGCDKAKGKKRNILTLEKFR
jgi:predicted Rossmann fold nucleotide-binding protein DprA/Smf involved in DNA uptake